MLSRTLSRISRTLKRKKIDEYDYWYNIIKNNKKIKEDILLIIVKNKEISEKIKILEKNEKIPTNIKLEYCKYVKKDIYNNNIDINECSNLNFYDTIIYFLQNLIDYLPSIKNYHTYKDLYLKKYKNSTLDTTQSELKNVNFFIEIDNNEQHLQSIKEKIISKNKIILHDKITDFYNTIDEIDKKNNFYMSNESDDSDDSDDNSDDNSSNTSKNKYSSNSSQKSTSSNLSDSKGGKRIKTKKQRIKSKKQIKKQKTTKNTQKKILSKKIRSKK